MSRRSKKVIELNFNLYEHEFVPKHEILAGTEIKDLLERFHIKPYQLPYIKASDPAVKWIGAKPGDILKITRKSITAGESLIHKYVVEG